MRVEKTLFRTQKGKPSQNEQYYRAKGSSDLRPLRHTHTVINLYVYTDNLIAYVTDSLGGELIYSVGSTNVTARLLVGGLCSREGLTAGGGGICLFANMVVAQSPPQCFVAVYLLIIQTTRVAGTALSNKNAFKFDIDELVRSLCRCRCLVERR